MFHRIHRRKSHSGQGLVEYAIIIALVALVSIVILSLVALAINRNYGLIAGVLGAKKDILTTNNHIYMQDTQQPQCGMYAGSLGFYAQFFSDRTDLATRTDITVTTDNGLVPVIQYNGPQPPGIGNYKLKLDIPAGVSCPNSIVIQTPLSLGGQTLAYPVLHKDFP